VNGTFLHTRQFLGYHAGRFEDKSALLLESGEVMGVFPAALSPGDPTLVVSHPGATYGGVVHQGRLSGTRMIEAVDVLRSYYAAMGCRKLLYKLVPYIHAQNCAQDDSYALFRHGAIRVRCDLSCAIDLAGPRSPSARRQRGLKKALRSVTLSGDIMLLDELWEVIGQNLSRKHGTGPVHRADELKLLHGFFPGEIFIRCALVEGKVEAGVVFFNSPTTWHAQYIASSETGHGISALDAVFDSAIAEARRAGARYFDFGISNEDEGRSLNDGLYRFKSEFGGGGLVHEFYELDLS
jgi:hypothetical protein